MERDAIFSNKSTKNLQWAFLEFEALLPIVASGAFYPEFDFHGNELQKLNSPIGSLNLLTFNLIPIAQKSYAVFGWIDKKQASMSLVNTLMQIDQSALASAIIQFCFDTSDNIFVRPSWWESLPAEIRKKLAELLANSTPGEKDPMGLKLVSDQLVSASLVDFKRNW